MTQIIKLSTGAGEIENDNMNDNARAMTIITCQGYDNHTTMFSSESSELC